MARAWWLLLSAALVVSSAGADGATPDASRAIELDDAIAQGSRTGPGVEVAKAPLPSLHVALTHASNPLLGPPVLSLAAGMRHGAFGAGLEASAGLSVEVPVRAIAAARTKWVDAARAATEQDLRRAKLDAALRAGLAWAALREAEVVLAVRQRSLHDAEAVAALARKRVAAGIAAPTEAALAEGEAGASRGSVVEAEGMATDARVELRAAMALRPDASISSVGALCTSEAALKDETSSLRMAVAREPTIALSTARLTLAARDVELLRATSGPTIGIGATTVREATGDWIWMGTIALPLPPFERGAFDGARALALVDTAAAQRARAEAELERALRVAVHDRHHTRELHATLRDDALAPLHKALVSATTQYAAGTIDASAVFIARQRAYAVEEQVTHACGEVRRADLRWARLVGVITDGGK